MNSGQFDDADDDENEMIQGGFRSSAARPRGTTTALQASPGHSRRAAAAALRTNITGTTSYSRQNQELASRMASVARNEPNPLAAPQYHHPPPQQQNATSRVAAAADYLAAMGAAQVVAAARQKAAEAIMQRQKNLQQARLMGSRYNHPSMQDQTLQMHGIERKRQWNPQEQTKEQFALMVQKEKELLAKGKKRTADFEHRQQRIQPQRAPSPPSPAATMPRKVSVRGKKGNSVQRVKKTWALTMYDEYGPIASASRYVGDELQHGLWPSPFPGFEIQHKAHMKIVAASLEEFCRLVILPSMQPETVETIAQQQAVLEKTMASKRNTTTSTKTKILYKPKPKKEKEHVFFSTLLALREVMTQNAERIFGKPSFEGLHDKKKKLEKSRKRKIHQLQDQQYCAKLLATGVVLAAMEQYNPNDAAIADRFLEVCRKYDEGDEEFTSCLVAEQNSCGVLPNGRRVDPEESIAMHVSFEQARESHPLTLCQKRRDMNVTPRVQDLLQVPEPNVCNISMVQHLPDCKADLED
jgi:hypothetical protein